MGGEEMILSSNYCLMVLEAAYRFSMSLSVSQEEHSAPVDGIRRGTVCLYAPLTW